MHTNGKIALNCLYTKCALNSFWKILPKLCDVANLARIHKFVKIAQKLHFTILQFSSGTN